MFLYFLLIFAHKPTILIPDSKSTRKILYPGIFIIEIRPQNDGFKAKLLFAIFLDFTCRALGLESPRQGGIMK